MKERLRKFILSFPRTYVVVRTDQYLSMLGVVTGGVMYAILDSKFFMWATIVQACFVLYTFIRDWNKPWAIISKDRDKAHHKDHHVEIR